MKRHLSLLATILVLVAMVFTLASCGMFGSDEHQHTYSDKWSNDETNHWHAATCSDGDECKSAKADEAAHTLSGNKCTVCGYEKPAEEKPDDEKPVAHVHTYATEWSKDETNHWHAATCNVEAGCATAKKDEAAHDFTNGDCVCGAKAPVHEHTYAETLTAGETTHWYAATCNVEAGCATAKKDEAAHDFTNGDCVCGAKAPILGPDGTAERPYPIEIPGTAKVSVEAKGVVYYTFTITEEKNLRITLDSANVSVACGTSVEGLLDNMYDVGAAKVLETTLAAGTYFVAFSTADLAAEEYNVTAEFYTKAPVVIPSLNEGRNTLSFTAAEIEAGEATRKLVIENASDYMFKGDLFVSKVIAADGTEITKNTDYSYTLAAGEYTLTFGMFSIFNTVADTDISLNVEDQNKEDVGGDDTDIDITGTYYGTDDFGNQSLTVVITDTTVTFTYNHPMMGETVATYTYEIVEGEVVLYDDDNNVVPAMGGFISLSINGVPVDAGFNGTNYTLSTTQGGGSEGGDGDDTTLPEVGTGTGAEEDPYIIAIPGDFTCAFPGGMTPIWYAFAAPADGTVTISTTFGENGWLQLGTEPMFCNTNDGDGTSLTLLVEKDTLYYAAVGDWSEVASTVPFSITFTEGTGGEGGGDDTTEIVTEGYLNDGENEVTITDAQYTAGKVYYAFTPWNEGEYAFQSGDLYISGVYLDGEALTTNDNGYYVLSAYTQYAVEITCTWAPSAGTYTVNAEFQYPLGHQQNPNWLWSLDESVTANYAGDYNAVWYTFYANVTGTLTVTTEDPAASIMLTAVFGNEVSNSDEEGNLTNSVSLYVIKGRQYYIGVVDANWSSTAREIVFTPSITEGEIVANGSQNVPYGLVIGANTASVPAWDNVYYMYTAAENGTLTLTTESTNCTWYVTTEFGKFEFTSETTISIDLYMDQIAYVCVSATDGAAGDIAFNASFKAAPKEVYFEGTIVNDGTAANEFVIEENTWVSFGFSGAGQYTVTWDNADAKVELVSWDSPNTVLASGDVIEGDTWGTNFIVYLPEYAAGTVKVTITPYVAETEASLVLGNNTITVADNQNGDPYNLPVSEEEVIYTITVGANGVVILNNGSDIYFEGNSVDITVPAGETVSVNIGAYSFSDNVANVTVAVKGTEVEGGEGEGGEEEDPVVVIPELEIGSTQYNAVEKTYSYTASMDGVLKLTSGNAIMGPVSFSYTVNGGDATTFEVSTTVEVALSAGDVLLLTISGTGYSSITAEFYIPPTEVAGTLANLGDNSFTLEANSYVLIPLQVMGIYQLTWTDANIVVEYQENGRAPFVVISSGAVASLNPMAGANLKIYLTGYAAGTATINVAEYVDTPVDAVVGDNTVNVVDTTNGKVVNLPVSEAEVTYVVTPGTNAVVIYNYEAFTEAVEITVAANATVSFNVATADYAAGDVVVNVAVKGSESEDGGNESASIDGTYIGAGTNSRGMMVVIDTAADTLVITRAQSGSLTDFEGGTTYTLKYSEMLAKANSDGLVAGSIAGTNIMNLTFDENGVVTALTWTGVVYSNYVKQ